MALVDQLRTNSGRIWTDATDHPFVTELGDGSLPEDKFRRYFIQDYVFVNQLAKVGGLAIAKAPDLVAARPFGDFLSVLLGAEDTLFLDAFEVDASSRRMSTGTQCRYRPQTLFRTTSSALPAREHSPIFAARCTWSRACTSTGQTGSTGANARPAEFRPPASGAYTSSGSTSTPMPVSGHLSDSWSRR